MNSNFLRNPHARWIIPLLSAMLLFVCLCMLYFAGTWFIIVQDLGYAPTGGFEQGYDAGYTVFSSNPTYSLLAFACLCSAILVPIVALVGGFLLINVYQKKQVQAESLSATDEAV